MRSIRKLDENAILKNENPGRASFYEVDWHGIPLDVRYASLFKPVDEPVKAATREGIADRYRLVGVMLQSDAAKSVAFIEEKERLAATARGDELEPSVTVKSIANRVWSLGWR